MHLQMPSAKCQLLYFEHQVLTHWGWVTRICIGNLTIIGSDNGLSPCRRQAIIWTNAEMLLIGPLGTNFSEILIEMHTFSFKKIHLKLSSVKWQPFCLGFNVLIHCSLNNMADILHTAFPNTLFGRKWWYFDSNFTEIRCHGSNSQHINIVTC